MAMITRFISQWTGRLIAGFILLVLIVSVASANGDASASKAVLEDVDYHIMPGGQIQMSFKFSKPVKKPKLFTIKTPPRIVLDFYGISNGLKRNRESFNQGALRTMTTVATPGRTRLVLDLNHPVKYTTQVKGDEVNVTLTDMTSAATPAKSKVPALASNEKFRAKGWAAERHQVTGVDFRKGKDGGGQIITDMSDGKVAVDVNQRGNQLRVMYLGATVPERLQRRLDVADFATPVRIIETRGRGHNVEMIISVEGNYEYLAYQVDNKFIIDVKQKVDHAKSGARDVPVYSGKRLSLNFQDIKVRAVLQLLADFTGINIVASDTVNGSITLRLKNVPWDQALDIILKTQGLAKRDIGNVILVAPAEEIASREKEELAAEKEVSELEPVRSELIQLNYAKASEIAALLKDQSNSLLSKRGNVSVDTRTNTLWMQDTPTRLKEVRYLVHRLDIPVKQVLIEARIVNVDTRFEEELGIRFGVTRPNHWSGTLSAANEIVGGVAPSATTVDPVTLVPASRLNVSLPAVSSTVAQVPSIGVALANLGKDYLLDLELSAIEVEGGGELISSPRLVTADQQAAFIEAGEEIPYQQNTSSGATSVEFKKAVLALRVTPQITPDHRIILQIKVNQDRRSSKPEVQGTPAIDTQQIETVVLVDNGETLVLGGIYKQNNANSVERVPFLGELPVIGHLFRTTKKEHQREELLIFITPKIIEEGFTSST